MTLLTAPDRTLFRRDGALRIREDAREQVRGAVLAFMDAAATATGRETFYNTREEQLEAERAVHEEVFQIDRGLYTIMLALPGVNDHTIQLGVQRLLKTAHPGEEMSLLDHDQERQVIEHVTANLPPQRLFKMFVAMQRDRINNRRTRRLVLRAILGSEKLLFWAVKYRTKLRVALRHALGTGVANGVLARTRKTERTGEDNFWLRRHLGRYLPASVDLDTVYQCVCFILGGRREQGFTLPLLKAFHEARFDLERGKTLPVEVLGGIRGRYHKDVPHARVLEIARDHGGMTENQKLALKRSAAKQDVEIEFDPNRADMVRLYVYALECGMTPAIRAALDLKARQAADRLPVRYERVGVIVDRSASMGGTAQGKFRPLAIALAMRDILVASATQATALASTGEFDEFGMIRPVGETNLAGALVRLMQDDFDAVYVLTDGYENAPAGRVDEVVRALRDLGVGTTFYQITPVLAGEMGSVRTLSTEFAPLPISRPEGLGLAMVRAALTHDVEKGVEGLMFLSRKLLSA